MNGFESRPDDGLATPAIMLPGMTEAEWLAEVGAMLQRSRMTTAFLAGTVDLETYSDALAEYGRDPHQLWDLWDEGISLL